MGGCLNARGKESVDTLPGIEIISSQSSLVYHPRNTAPKVTSPRISQMVRYFCTDQVIQFSGTGFFSSPSGVNGITPSDTSTMNTISDTNTEVTSQLILGSLDDAMNEAELRAKKVTHIISLIGHMHPISGIKQKQCPMNDYGQTDLKWVMTKLREFVEESQMQGNVLFVHCMSGQNRSATVMLAILMKYQGLTLYQAYKKVKNKRPIVQINERYGKQLMSMEQELFGRVTLPENWMQIDSVDMQSGRVTFIGDCVSPAVASVPQTTRGFRNQNVRARLHLSPFSSSSGYKCRNKT